MQVRFAGRAEADLANIEGYIAADNPGRALTFIQELRASCLALAGAPQAYPVISRYRGVELRRKAHGNYLIFYRINGSVVVIARVLHGARDYGRLLNKDR